MKKIPPKPIPPWLRKIIDESVDPVTCMQAIRREVMPEWRKKHPRPRKKPGPRAPLVPVPVAVRNAVIKVFDNLSPMAFKEINWKGFIEEVQKELGDSPYKRRGVEPHPYNTDLIRLVARHVMVTIPKANIPPGIIDHRRQWKSDATMNRKRPVIFTAEYDGQQYYLPATATWSPKVKKVKKVKIVTRSY
mgnify:CR=1 FL=1